MQPAVISARPDTIIKWFVFNTPLNPAVRANGTVKPSDMPMIMSFTNVEFLL
jgi:hypothetical protein